MNNKQTIISAKHQISISLALALLCLSISFQSTNAKFMRGSMYDDLYDSPYASSSMPTGDRAIVTIRGARNPYTGSAPSKLILDDDPYRRGPYPRGIYDRLDNRYNRPMYPELGLGGAGLGGYGYAGYPGAYNRPYGGHYDMSAPSRLAVTGAYPYRYGSRW